MPAEGIETLRVNDLLITIYLNLKELQDIIARDPNRQVKLFEEFIAWKALMQELLQIIAIHRDLALPDDAPTGLLKLLPPSDSLMEEFDVMDRLGAILSIPVVNITPYSSKTSQVKLVAKPKMVQLLNQEVCHNEKKNNVFLNFFGFGSKRMPSVKIKTTTCKCANGTSVSETSFH